MAMAISLTRCLMAVTGVMAIRMRIEDAKRTHSDFVRRSRTAEQQENFLESMREPLKIGAENYGEKIWADSSISQAERRGKIAVLDDYFGEVVTR